MSEKTQGELLREQLMYTPKQAYRVLSEEELAARKAKFHWEFPAEKYPRFLRLFVKNVGSMAKGGIWE